MKERGFSLIELLAVIVILAIIALIATPIVLNIIEESKKSAFKQTANVIIDAANLYYYNKEIKGELINENIRFIFPNSVDELDLQGKFFGQGEMILIKDGKIALAMSNEKYCVTKSMVSQTLTIEENFEECSLPEAVNGIMSSMDYCILDGICKNGTLVNVKVNDEENYDFYVINDIGNELTLIMDRNVGAQVAWNSAASITKGPVTALNKLKELTNGWTNILEQEFVYNDDGANKYSNVNIIMRTRLPNYTELNNLKLLNENKMPSYLYTNLSDANTIEKPLGYWTSSAESTNSYNGVFLMNSGGFFNVISLIQSSKYGVRPVITLFK